MSDNCKTDNIIEAILYSDEADVKLGDHSMAFVVKYADVAELSMRDGGKVDISLGSDLTAAYLLIEKQQKKLKEANERIEILIQADRETSEVRAEELKELAESKVRMVELRAFVEGHRWLAEQGVNATDPEDVAHRSYRAEKMAHEVVLRAIDRLSTDCTVPPSDVGGEWPGERCKSDRCGGRRNVIGFIVDDDAWAAVVGNADTILCPQCFDELAQSKGVKYKFKDTFPVSWSDWDKPDTVPTSEEE